MVPTHKAICSEELRWLRDTCQSGCAAWYKALVAQLPRLRKAGVHVLDASAIFDGFDQDVYQDDCCHFSAEGNRMLVQAIVHALEEKDSATGIEDTGPISRDSKP